MKVICSPIIKLLFISTLVCCCCEVIPPLTAAGDSTIDPGPRKQSGSFSVTLPGNVTVTVGKTVIVPPIIISGLQPYKLTVST